MAMQAIIYIISFVILIFCASKGMINLGVLQDNHFNLITINAVFAGFLYTSLSIIIGLNDDKFLVSLEKRNLLGNVYHNIVTGIAFSTISIAISLVNILIIEKSSTSISVVNFARTLEVGFLLFSIMAFVFSVHNITRIINSIRTRKRKDLFTLDDAKKLLYELKQVKNDNQEDEC